MKKTDIEKAMFAFLRMMAGDDPASLLREGEVSKGHTLVPVGSVPWLPADDWGERDVVSLDGDEVRLVAIGAARPGTGALHRLLDAVAVLGLQPVVICPLGTMETILTRWGWDRVEIGDCFESHEEQWRPRREARGEAAAAAGTGTPAKAANAAGGPASRESEGN